MRRTLAIPVALLATLGVATRAIAHGTTLEYQSTQAIEIQANYDTGDPMANAQVAVFAPDNPAEPWLTGVTDEQGQFVFSPDPAIAGNWDVQVRQAGHGDIISIPVGEDAGETAAVASVEATSTPAAIAGGSEEFSPLQKIVMVSAVIWGFVGTALFFSARKK